MTKPFVYFGTAAATALFAANHLGFTFAAALFFIALTTGIISYLLRHKSRYITIAFLCAMGVFISSASFCTHYVTEYLPAKSFCSESAQTVSGRLISYETAYGSHYYTVDDVSFNGNQTDIKVRIHSQRPVDAKIDDILTVAATVYENGSSTDNTDYYKSEGIFIGASTSGSIEVTHAEKHSVRYYINEIRLYIKNALLPLNNETSVSVALALLTGDTDSLDEGILRNFRNSGIAHLFAVSGFHLSFWTTGIVMFTDNIFKRKSTVSTVVAVVFVFFFMTLTGFTKSVIRAGIMTISVFSGRLINRKTNTINSLFTALSVILLLNPFAVMSISLQLSALATLGIVILSSPVSHLAVYIKRRLSNPVAGRIVSAVVTAFLVSVAAGIFIMPVSAISLDNFSLISPVTNLLCLSAAQIIMILSAFSVILSPVAALSKPLLVPVALLTQYILSVTEKLAATDYSVVDTSSSIAKIVFAVISAIIFVLIYRFRKCSKKLGITMLASCISIMTVSSVTTYIQLNTIKITVPDTGNGTAVILNVHGKDILIGCGGSKYKESGFTSAADNNKMSYDFLLVPGTDSAESAYMATVIDRYTIRSCITCTDDSYITDNCVTNLDENCKLLYINNNSFSGARIETAKFACTIIFSPVVDFSCVDSSWLKGNLLITRQNLPDADLSGFSNIIISTSSEKAYTQNNIRTTRQCGQIIYRFYPFYLTTLSEADNDFK